MKTNIFLLTFFICSWSGMSQTSADFRLKTDFKDTLVTGYQNIVCVESSFNLSRVILSGEKMTISEGSKTGEYKVIVSPVGKYAELIINYTSKDGTTYAYIYTYRIVPLTENMISRLPKK